MKNAGVLLITGLLLVSTLGTISFGSEDETSRAIGNSDWPLFRGDTKHTGLSQYSTSENPGRLKWSFMTTGRIRTSPVIGPEGNIYFCSDDGLMYALNETGSQQWTFNVGNFAGSGVNDLYDSTPLVDSSGNVYVATDSGNMYSFTSSGASRWKQVLDMRGQVRSSPVMDDDDNIYIGTQSSMSGGSMTALYGSNGTIKWRYRTDSGIISSPAVDADGNIVFGSQENKFFCLYPNGTENWIETANSAKGLVVSSPAIDDEGNIYFGHYGKGSPGVLWSFDSSGDYNWDYSAPRDFIYSSPAIGPNGRIYVGSNDKALHAVNANDGSLFKIYMTLGNVISSPAVDKDGLIYFGSEDNYLYSLNNDMTLRWKFQTNGMIHSSPAICEDGSILVGSDDGYLYSIQNGKPSMPLDFTAVGGNAEVSLDWVEPEQDGGSDIIKYNIYRNEDGMDQEVFEVFPPSTDYIDTDVMNGKTYEYEISAENIMGESERTETLSVTPMTVPDPVTNLSVHNGSGFLIIDWDLPLEDGGTPLTNITLLRGNDELSLQSFIELPPNSVSFNDTSVINGEIYHYQIVIGNKVGVSEGSEIVGGIPMGIPTEPLNLTAVGMDGYVILTWDTPIDFKGSPLVGYEIYSGPAPGSETLLVTTVNNSYNHTDVENGETYHYYVRSLNGIGLSDPSEGAMATPMGLPSSPVNLYAVQIDDHIKLTWDEPEDDGGNPITTYRLYVSVNGGEFQPLSFVPAGELLEFSDHSTVDPNNYAYRVTAMNEIGESILFSEVNVTFTAAPDAPTGLITISGNGYVHLYWEAPEYDGGSPLTGFRIFREVNGTVFEFRTLSPDSIEYNDTTAVNGEIYYYSIIALNIRGESGRTESVIGSPTEPEKAPSRPMNVRATLDEDRINVVWSPPMDDGGSSLKFFHLYRQVNDNETALLVTVNSDVLFYNDDDVAPGNIYNYSVSAENGIGVSLLSEITSVTIEDEEVVDPPVPNDIVNKEEKDNTALFILIGIGVLLVIMVLIVLITVLRKKPDPSETQGQTLPSNYPYEQNQQLQQYPQDISSGQVEATPIGSYSQMPQETEMDPSPMTQSYAETAPMEEPVGSNEWEQQNTSAPVVEPNTPIDSIPEDGDYPLDTKDPIPQGPEESDNGPSQDPA